MLFNSPAFIVFLPVVLTLYWVTPEKHRWKLLLAASYYFYGSWEPAYLLLIMTSTAVDYTLARRMGGIKDKKARRKYVWLSALVNGGLLFTFKYLDFTLNSVEEGLRAAGVLLELPRLELLLPVGISFFTFQSFAYVIDVYRGVRKPEENLARYALYVSFFPQLVAGPIERASALMPQLRNLAPIQRENVWPGVSRILTGLVKKVVVGDRLGQLVIFMFQEPDEFGSLFLWLAAYGFAFQIYFDLSGYCDIAIGTARLFGVKLSENFNRPFLAATLPEFWRRWHITLMNWFRDYVFIPLTGLRASDTRLALSMVVIFVLSGVWHGAAWTFIAWGAIHGVMMGASVFATPLTKRLDKSVKGKPMPSGLLWAGRVFMTFHLVVLTEIFFRARSFADALKIVQTMLWSWRESSFEHALEVVRPHIDHWHVVRGALFPSLIVNIAIVVIGVGLVMILELIGELKPEALARFRASLGSTTARRWAFCYVTITLLALLGEWHGIQFIYFQF